MKSKHNLPQREEEVEQIKQAIVCIMEKFAHDFPREVEVKTSPNRTVKTIPKDIDMILF